MPETDRGTVVCDVIDGVSYFVNLCVEFMFHVWEDYNECYDVYLISKYI